MNKKQIISKVEEILHKKYDTGGIDSELVEDCINNTLEAINYSQCYTELKKEILFELRKENHIIPNDIMELISFSLENITSFMEDSEKKERINILFNRLENKEQLLSTIEFKNNCEIVIDKQNDIYMFTYKKKLYYSGKSKFKAKMRMKELQDELCV